MKCQVLVVITFLVARVVSLAMFLSFFFYLALFRVFFRFEEEDDMSMSCLTLALSFKVLAC